MIEPLIAIGIIAAPEAITVPLVTRFAGKEDEGALKAETETVQGAMNAMMADKGITPLSGGDKGTTSYRQNTWTALPGGTGTAALDGYLKNMNGGIAAPSDTKAAAARATPTWYVDDA